MTENKGLVTGTRSYAVADAGSTDCARPLYLAEVGKENRT